MLCFDPTRGIDIRTKHQIYVLLRDLAEAGAAVLLYTSELKEIQLVCDRAIVIFGGRVVAEIDAADADEPTLLRAAYNLTRRTRRCPRRSWPRSSARRGVAERRGAERRRPGAEPRRRPPTPARTDRAMTRRDRRRRRPRRRVSSERRGVGAAQRLDARPARVPRPSCWSSRSSSSRTTASPASRAWRSRSCRWRSPPSAQAIVVISGGIDLSIGVDDGPHQRRRGRPDEGPGRGVRRRGRRRRSSSSGCCSARSTARLVVVTRVPDIVVTLAMSFVWAGCALLVLHAPGGGAASGSRTSSSARSAANGSRRRPSS